MWRNNATPPFMPAAPAGRRAGLHKRGPGCYGAPPVSPGRVYWHVRHGNMGGMSGITAPHGTNPGSSGI
ncbi:hypothetical protein SXCC_01648 [Gluconacetobacter sp. SXCC-1]|nr:hypothetical protein SXCC_01648 [Gluconacetobacter sp. SXCC-1]